MIKDGVIVLFYVDEIVFTYPETGDVSKKELEKSLEITEIGDLKWFLGIHVLKRISTISDARRRVEASTTGHQASRNESQQKVGSILFATISTLKIKRTSRLARDLGG